MPFRYVLGDILFLYSEVLVLAQRENAIVLHLALELNFFFGLVSDTIQNIGGGFSKELACDPAAFYLTWARSPELENL